MNKITIAAEPYYLHSGDTEWSANLEKCFDNKEDFLKEMGKFWDYIEYSVKLKSTNYEMPELKEIGREFEKFKSNTDFGH